jgi:hypothetical protein
MEPSSSVWKVNGDDTTRMTRVSLHNVNVFLMFDIPTDTGMTTVLANMPTDFTGKSTVKSGLTPKWKVLGIGVAKLLNKTHVTQESIFI